MPVFLSAALLGFLLGMRHATDADHVVAISTIVGRERSFAGASAIGILWGVGHTVTVTMVGLVIIVFGLVIPPAVGLTLELLVGLMLIALGVLTLTGRMGRLAERLAPPHRHLHVHADAAHSHPHDHAHELEDLDEAGDDLPVAPAGASGGAGVLARLGAFHVFRPIAIGLVHGLAGSAAVALLVLSTVPGLVGQLVYLAVFNVGVMSGMGIVTTVIGLPFVVASGRFVALHRGLMLASGLVSLGLGLLLIYQVGFVGGLFTGNPVWEPG